MAETKEPIKDRILNTIVWICANFWGLILISAFIYFLIKDVGLFIPIIIVLVFLAGHSTGKSSK